MPLRLRLAVLFAVATGAVLTVGGFVFVHQLSTGILHSVDSTLQTRAADIADAISQPGSTPQGVLEASRSAPLPLGGSEAQVLDSKGSVLSSTSASHRPLIPPWRVAAARDHTLRFTAGVTEPQRFIVATVQTQARPLTVVVRSEMEGGDEAVDRVERLFVFGGFPIALLAGLAGWLLAGAALRPVERMRRQVADLTEDDLGPTLDVPGTRDELAALAVTMNDLLDRVRRTRRRERGFVAEAGHELRTPLAILQGELELANRPGRTTEEMRAALSVAADESERLSRLAEDLLVLARSDEGVMPFHPQPTEVAPLAAAALAAATSRAADRRVEFRLDDRGAGLVDLDPDRFRQALDNLVDNAVRHAPPGSTVTLRLDRADHEVRSSVLDEGDGFPPDFLGHAMERFAKADPPGGGKGAGLGLAIVRAVASAHGGRAWVANRADGGAEAGVAIPTGAKGETTASA